MHAASFNDQPRCFGRALHASAMGIVAVWLWLQPQAAAAADSSSAESRQADRLLTVDCLLPGLLKTDV